MRIFWTDGSAVPNPGRGGFAVLEIIDDVPVPVILGSEENSSNMRMEGSALIAAMKKASGEECEIHTDSEFWVDVLTKWAPEWQKNGWTRRKPKSPSNNPEESKKQATLFDIDANVKRCEIKEDNEKYRIKNLEMIKEAYELYKNSRVKLFWTKGHINTTYNELADEWANRARKGAKLANK